MKAGLARILGRRGYGVETISYIILEMVNKFIPFLAIPVLARNMSKQDYGNFVLFMSTLTIVSILLDLGQRVAMQKFWLGYPRQTMSFVTVAGAVSLTVSLLAIGFMFLFGLKLTISNEVSYLIVLCASVYTLIDMKLSYYQISRKLKPYSIWYALRSLVPYAVAVLCVLGLTPDFSKIIRLISASFLVLGIFLIFFQVRETDFKHHRPYLLFGMVHGLPILPSMISSFVLNYADRFIIERVRGADEVAEYAIVYTVGNLLLLAGSATNRSWQPFVLEQLKAGNTERLRSVSLRYAGLFLLISLGILLTKDLLLRILVGVDYVRVPSAIVYLIAGSFFWFLYSMHTPAVLFTKKTAPIIVPSIVASVFNIIANWYFIPQYGYLAASMITAVSFVVQFVIVWCYCRFSFGIRLL